MTKLFINVYMTSWDETRSLKSVRVTESYELLITSNNVTPECPGSNHTRIFV